MQIFIGFLLCYIKGNALIRFGTLFVGFEVN